MECRNERKVRRGRSQGPEVGRSQDRVVMGAEEDGRSQQRNRSPLSRSVLTVQEREGGVIGPEPVETSS